MRYQKQERLRLPGEDPADELDEEIRIHLEMRTEALIASGLTPEEARAEAERRFGDMARARRALKVAVRRHEQRRRLDAAFVGSWQDVRFAYRSLAHAKAFSTFSVAILAAAIGLTTLTFTVTDHVLLRPLPFAEPSRLVTLQSVSESGPFNSVSMPNWVDWKERGSTLAATALWRSDPVTVQSPGGEPFRVEGIEVHGDFWGTLAARFLLGRPLTEAETQSGERLVVVSEGLWRRALGATTDVSSASLTLNGRSYGVSGVLAAGFEFPEGAEVWIPTRYTPGSGGMRNNINYEAIGRLGAGVTIEQAAADLSGVALGIRQSDPEALYSYGVGVISLQERVVGGSDRTVSILMKAVLLVLLVASANLAGLSLARARRRENDAAVRLALGAGRGRLARQVMTEHVLLSALGGAVGLGLAAVASAPLASYLTLQLPRAREIRIDAPAILFALLTAAVAALLTSAGPVLSVLRGHIATGVQHARGKIRGGRGIPGFFMVAAEVALATSLLVGGALLVRSFYAAASRPLGYDPENVVTLDVTLVSSGYSDARAGVEYWTSLLERLRAQPGVAAAAAGNWIPTGGSGTSFIELEGVEPSQEHGAGYRVVSDEYLGAMGITLLGGRTFNATDVAGGERVGLVNQAFVDRYWSGEPPLGKHIKATSMEAYYNGGVAPWITVVGVVGDVRHYGFEEDPVPELFVLYRQVPDWTRGVTAVVRTEPGADMSVERLREVAREVDPSLAVQAATLESRVSSLLAERRLSLSVLWTFAALALVLSCLGLYALMSFAAQERRRELAIRATLGANQRGIVALMLVDAGRVLGAGLALGLAAGYGVSRLLASLLVDVSASDPVSYGGAALLLAAVGVFAALVPAWRAARADPLAALTP